MEDNKVPAVDTTGSRGKLSIVFDDVNSSNSDSFSCQDHQEALRVLDIEARSLSHLAKNVPRTFSNAVEILLNTRHRVIVTGMGKSGHVGTKLAATLSSTGTPSYFVHPAEASHGDLGMILAGDTLIAMSNSGETSELSDILAHAKRRDIPVIGITSRQDSTLDSVSDVALILPTFEEACPLRLAPTTSTTLMMALGDALAMALLARKRFSKKDFGALHPGGQLGQILRKVQDLMHTGSHIPLVNEKADFQEALFEMTSKSFGCTGVTNNQGILLGVITDGDLRRHFRGDTRDLCLNTMMTRHPVIVSKEILATEAVKLMNKHHVTSLFICDEAKRPIGIIHIHDCLRAGIS